MNIYLQNQKKKKNLKLFNCTLCYLRKKKKLQKKRYLFSIQ